MNFKILLTGLFLLFTGAARAESTVTKCTYDTMKAAALKGLQAKFIDDMKSIALNPIVVKPQDVTLEDKGVVVFEEVHGLGSQPEHAFAVSLKSQTGTNFLVTNAEENPRCTEDTLVHEHLLGYTCFDRPKKYLVSIPDPQVVNQYDNEGNLVAKHCVSRLIGKYNRYIIYMNINTEILVEHDLVNSTVLATAKIVE